MAEDLEAVRAPCALRREEEREVVAHGGEDALEQAAAGAVGVAEAVLHGRPHGPGIGAERVARAEVGADRELRVEDVAPVAEAVERAVLHEFGILRRARPHRIPGRIAVVGTRAVPVAGEVVGGKARVGADARVRLRFVDVDGGVAHRAASLRAVRAGTELLGGVEVEREVVGRFGLDARADGRDLLVGDARAAGGRVGFGVLVEDVELVGEASVDEPVVPDEAAAPFVHLGGVAGMEGREGASAREAVAPADVVAAVVVEREGVELRGVGGVEGETRHVREAGARTVVGRAVLEDAVKPEDGVAPLQKVLAAEAQVEEAVEEAASFQVEVVEHHFVGEGVVAVPALDTVLDGVFAHLVDEASVEGEALGIEAGPHAGTVADVVLHLLVGARHHGAGRAGEAGHVVHDFLADAQVGPRVEGEGGRLRRRSLWNGVCFGAAGECDGESGKNSDLHAG